MNSDMILILAPSLNDGKIAQDILRDAGLDAKACANARELTESIRSGCGVAVVARESLSVDAADELERILSDQPAWSDLPLILLTTHESARLSERLAEKGNTSLLERPFSKQTLVRAVEVALRARRRQYQVKALLTELTKSKELAVQASLTKTQFLANMSHEIRTPIGAIIGFSDLLKAQTIPADERERYIEIVNRNSHQLLRLIDDILDLSKVEAGKLSIEKIEFNLPDLLADLNSIMKFRASEKGIEYRVHLNSLIPKTVTSDPGRLRQILSNMSGNAIKFTEFGFVELQVTYARGQLHFTVEDSGLGLSERQTQTLFEPFTQADSSTTRKFGGTGLGLTISKQLAHAMGGDVKLVTSALGKGSVFDITVQVEVDSSAPLVGPESLEIRTTFSSPAATTETLKGLNVLVVEDSPDNQILITRYLRRAGCTVTTASDGLEGYERAHQGQFDVILMDIQMPIMDGHQATKRLRSEGYRKPVIALTAHAMIEERRKGLESGFTDYLTKPVQPRTLIDLLGKLVATR